jgi:hypothetical protein
VARDRWTWVRVPAGLVAAGLVAAVAALMTGEYEIDLWLGLAAGALTGLAVGEVTGTVGRTGSWLVAGAAGVIAAVALVWAGRIDAGHGLEPVKTGAWAGAVAAGLVALWRVRAHRGAH